MASVMTTDSCQSDEEYVISRAKSALKDDPTTAKAWMITAKTLYKDNFSVQFEAYKIEKDARNIKEAAKYLSKILGKFQQQPELWQEINAMTTALRSEVEPIDPELKFLSDMFQNIPSDVQRDILLVTADHCEDTMEHCRLLLLLLKRFPQTIVTHGPKLVDTLLTAEKHSHSGTHSMNNFRQLLVCELLPLFANTKITVDLPPKLLFRLLNKAIEFYICYIVTPNNVNQDTDSFIEQPWIKLFSVLELAGRNLHWDSGLITFGQSLNKEVYWQRLITFCKAQKNLINDDQNISKQLLYCLTTFFLYCLYEYTNSQNMNDSPLFNNMLLLEALSDSSLPRPLSEPKSKRRKTDDENNLPHITIDKPGTQSIINNFLITCNCWDLLHSSEFLEREFNKLTTNLKLETWLNNFILDFAIYKNRYSTAITLLQMPTEPSQNLCRYLRFACIHFFQRQYSQFFENVLLILGHLPTMSTGQLSSNLTVGGIQRHLHFIPLTQLAVLQYCVRLLTYAIKENSMKPIGVFNDLSLGNMLVLIQLDWPQQEELLSVILKPICQRGTFHFPLLQAYVINVDILEELMYIWTEQGGNVVLDIFLTPQSLSQRRIGTRGADKGVKEDFKQAMRRQVSRCNDPIDQLIMKFITAERIHLLQSLM